MLPSTSFSCRASYIRAVNYATMKVAREEAAKLREEDAKKNVEVTMDGDDGVSKAKSTNVDSYVDVIDKTLQAERSLISSDALEMRIQIPKADAKGQQTNSTEEDTMDVEGGSEVPSPGVINTKSKLLSTDEEVQARYGGY